MGQSKRYSRGIRERAVRMVLEHEEEYPSQWAAIESISEKFGCTSETLRRWVRRTERDSGRREGPTTEERERVKELERENRELRRANEILRKASARPTLRVGARPRRSSTADPSDGALPRGPWRGLEDVELATLE